MGPNELLPCIFNRERSTFLIVGTLAVIIDFIVYQFFVIWIASDASLAKSLGFVSGASFSYIANGRFTFRVPFSHRTQLWRFFVLYLITLFLNVAVNALVLKSVSASPTMVFVAFLMATGASTVTNFVGMKFIVFRRG